ncbi:hypothetical protein [Leadbettera azotonutricia]|uniref:Uncharacterized protein n=1 Tax=Leadbettera azotonutricia (strain ATCC BAA-888 / DSM 13862 / ZAS-9) TaxID=545695 RepID=F5YGA9_LEAAZ|nr:hypothetical protein [Leadbettera azotonutricia]AEF80576.1 conserved hypothetical protein [Leadbettera azotonutricia ZAS-9]
MKLKLHNLAILLALLFAGLVAVQAAEQPPAAIGINIRYFDKRIYYLETGPILVQVTLTNNSPGTFRFKLADERVFSVDFDVKTTTNRPVEAADILVRKRSQSQQVYFREISVEAGESFSFVEDIRDFALLNKAGSYVVQARIYPELYYPSAVSGDSQPLASNRLTLNIRPPLIPGPDGVPLALDVETNAVLARERLPPDEVVSYLLTARQKEQWEKFFLYLDLEAMLSHSAPRRRQWLAEGEEGRQRMLARYRTELQSETVDGDIATIPKDFTIERTVYGQEEGTVTVLEYFKVGTYTEKKRYTYYLRRSNDIWTIVDYSVVNLGTQ